MPRMRRETRQTRLPSFSSSVLDLVFQVAGSFVLRLATLSQGNFFLVLSIKQGQWEQFCKGQNLKVGVTKRAKKRPNDLFDLGPMCTILCVHTVSVFVFVFVFMPAALRERLHTVELEREHCDIRGTGLLHNLASYMEIYMGNVNARYLCTNLRKQISAYIRRRAWKMASGDR